MPCHCRKRKHISAWLSWQYQAVHVLGYEAGVQLSSLKGWVLAQALQEPHISRQPAHLDRHMATQPDQLFMSNTAPDAM